MARLEVHQLTNAEIYSDTIRVHLSARNAIKEGRICRVSVDGGSAELFAVRGLPESEKGWVRLDEIGRERLGVLRDRSYEFAFKEAKTGELRQDPLEAVHAS